MRTYSIALQCVNLIINKKRILQDLPVRLGQWLLTFNVLCSAPPPPSSGASEVFVSEAILDAQPLTLLHMLRCVCVCVCAHVCEGCSREVTRLCWSNISGCVVLFSSRFGASVCGFFFRRAPIQPSHRIFYLFFLMITSKWSSIGT